MKSVCSIGGQGQTLTVDDVIRVANGSTIEVDSNVLARIKKQASQAATPPSPLQSLPTDPLRNLRLPTKLKRAAAFVRLATLISSKSGIRPDSLTQLLNGLSSKADLFPSSAMSWDSAWMTSLASGLGVDSTDNRVFESGTPASSGVTCMNVHLSKALLPIANAVVSMTCEALGASIKPLEQQRMESCFGKNAQDTAEAIRTLLSGSKRINSKEGVGCVTGICDIPQIHGSLLDSISALQISLRSELNAQVLDAKSLEEFPVATSGTFLVHVQHLAKSLVAAADSCLKRTGYLIQKIPELTVLSGIPDADPIPSERLEEVKGESEKVNEGLVGRLEGLRDLAKSLNALEDSCPASGFAVITYEVLEMMMESLAVESALGLLSLKALEGPSVAPAPSAALKKDKKAKGGLVMGKGTSEIRQYLMLQLNEGEVSWDAYRDPLPIYKGWLGKAKTLLSLEEGRHQEIVQTIVNQIETHQVRRKPKIPKGARDFLPDQMKIRQTVFDKITSVFKRHGAVSIDTPVFELKETLTGKYGEDSKLIYDLADQGGEILSLRYDLTVPFARYVALNSVGNIKRYHIGKVYRRDQPQMTKGRYREFFQCDFDIAGNYSVMVPDAECVKVLIEILQELDLGEFEVKINHRRLIDAMMDICGVPSEKFRSICSAIDKLDKEDWETVKSEMVLEKGLSEDSADRLGEFVQLRGSPATFIDTLMQPGHPFMDNSEAVAALKELEVLVEYLKRLDALQGVVFDLSLARGLDYYSGLIYEAVFKGSGTGSVAAGGRYDKLVGMFSGKDVPAVGVSIGVERVFSVMETQMKDAAKSEGTTIRSNDTQVLVASIGNGLQTKRMEICSLLWKAGIAAEFGYKPNPKMGDSLNYALQEGIPFMALFGEDELKEGLIKIKDLNARTEDSIPFDSLVPELRKRLSSN